jgi:hypothetical protein
VQIGVVEVTPLDPPRLVIHLRPLCSRIDIHFEIGYAKCALAGLYRGVRRYDDVLRHGCGPRCASASTSTARAAAKPQQHLVAVGGKAERTQILSEPFAAPGLEIKTREHQAAAARSAAARSSGLGQIEIAGPARRQRLIVARRQGQRDDALLQFIEIDSHRFGWGFRDRGTAARPATSSTAASGLRRRPRLAFFIALGRQRRRDVVRQHR